LGRFYHHIMVPLDTSTDSEHALPFALTIAELENASISLVHVAAPPGLGAAMATAGAEGYVTPAVNQDVIIQTERQVERRLLTIASDIEQTSEIRVETTVIEDPDVGHALAEYAEKTSPELTVMTTHDRTRLERWLLGSVAESLVRRIPAPTLLVKAFEERVDLSTRASISHILVPIDGSQLSLAILPHVRVMASLSGARVTLFTVIEPAIIAAPVGIPGAISATVPSEADANATLSGHADELRDIGIATDAVVVTDPAPRRAILDYAREHQVDLIAMSTHGRHGFARLVAGSVATQVLHHTGIPVLMYRPDAGRQAPGAR
jgi:nucleotide-binding universal stress UspA family protein